MTLRSFASSRRAAKTDHPLRSFLNVNEAGGTMLDHTQLIYGSCLGKANTESPSDRGMKSIARSTELSEAPNSENILAADVSPLCPSLIAHDHRHHSPCLQ
jgi:hypothetical protein